MTIPVQYFIARGVVRFPSTAGSVDVNFSIPGPGPNPDPDPGNDLLEPVVILGKSNVPNELVKADENEDIFANIELVDPIEDGDTYQVKWNDVDIGLPYVIDKTNDKVGDTISIALDWDVIRSQGPSATMPVWYKLSNAAHGNPQEPDPRTSVKIDFLTFTLPPAVAQHTIPSGILNCNSLRYDSTGTEIGAEYLIPPSSFLTLGATVHVEYNGYTDYFATSPVLVPGTNKKQTFTNITQEQVDNGIIWLVAPYDKHLLPIWSELKPSGMGEVTYRIENKPADPTPTKTHIVLSQGQGSCDFSLVKR